MPLVNRQFTSISCAVVTYRAGAIPNAWTDMMASTRAMDVSSNYLNGSLPTGWFSTTLRPDAQ
jgi:hypothetical protein